MKKRYIYLLGVVTMLSLSGCDATRGGDSSSDDSIKVTLPSDTRIVIGWEKNYSGYSEVLARESGVTRRTGYFMTQNSTGNYELTCDINTQFSREVGFTCKSTGSGYLSTYSQLSKMKNDTVYNFQISQGTEHNYQEVSYKVAYNASSNRLEFR